MIYARQSGLVGEGDGSLQAPYEHLADAFADAMAVDESQEVIIAVAVDAGPVSFTVLEGSRSVTILGACPAESSVAVTLPTDTTASPTFKNLDLSLRSSGGDTPSPTPPSVRVEDGQLSATVDNVSLTGHSVIIRRLSITNGTAELSRVTDSPIRTLPAKSDAAGRIEVSGTATLRLSRARIASAPIDPGQPDGIIEPRDTVIPAILGWASSSIEIDRSSLHIGSVQSRGDLSIADSWVWRDPLAEESLAEADHRTTHPGVLTAGGVTTFRRIVVEGAGAAALLVKGATVETAADLLIRDGSGDRRLSGLWDPECPAHYGRAIEVQRGGELHGNRIVIDRARDVGVFVSDAGSRVELTNLVLARQDQQLCATPEVFQEETCAVADCEWNAVAGLLARDDGTLRVDGFLVEESALAGVLVGPTGRVELANGEVRGNRIGVSIQDASDDEAFSHAAVTWTDNDVDLDSNAVEVPDPLGEWICDNDIDDDLDGHVDCADSDCGPSPHC